MSSRYAPAVVLTLNETVWPLLTLMSVAKPWMLGSPAPPTSHSLAGLPGLEFSHTIGFTTGGSHGPAALVGRVAAIASSKPAKANASQTRGRRPEDRVA